MPFMLGLASLSLISRLVLCTLPDELPSCLALLPSALPSIPSPLYTPSLTRYHMRQGTPDLPEVRTCSQADLKRRHTRRLETQDRRGTTVSVGDMVTLEEGHYKGTSATVKHIMKASLFLHSK